MIAIKYIIEFLLDKFWLLISFFDKIDEYSTYKSSHETNIYNLMRFDYKERNSLEWNRELVKNNLPKLESMIYIYRLNLTLSENKVIKYIKYLIFNKFWTLLNIFNIDTYNWSDKEVYERMFLPKALCVYYLVINKKESCIVLSYLDKGHLEFFEVIYDIKVPLWRMRYREIIYEKQKNIIVM